MNVGTALTPYSFATSSAFRWQAWLATTSITDPKTYLFNVHFEPQDVLLISKLLVELVDLWRHCLALRAPGGEAIDDEDTGGVLCLIKSSGELSSVSDLSVTHSVCSVDG